jgi:hypothetical protein
MPDDRHPPQLHGYLFGKLTPSEEEELARRALADQEVFEALFETSEDREALQDPALRRRLIRSLEASQDPERWWTGILQPWPGRRIAAVAMVVAVALAAVWLVRLPGGKHPPLIEQTLSLKTGAGSPAKSFLALPLRPAAGVGLTLDHAERRPGELLRVTVKLPAPSSVFLFLQEPDGRAALVWPGAAARADMPAGEASITLDASRPTDDIQSRRSMTLRLLVLPPGLDVRTQSVDWSRPELAYAAVEARYDVVP